MSLWWEKDPNERYWMEITRRADLGTNLLAPKLDQGGRANPAYVLFIEANPGDVVFHYDAEREAIVGYSTVHDRAVSTTMRWEARGTYARARDLGPQQVNAWELPLEGYTVLPTPVARADVIELRDEVLAIRTGLEAQFGSPVYFPFAPYRDHLRAAQSYITKMPRDLALLLDGTAAVVTSIETGVTPIEVAEARVAIERAARPARRQRHQQDPVVRVAVELFAMSAAAKHYEDQGWDVKDVSRTESFDLLCTLGSDTLHVEVKGTQSTGDAILLTPNEVAHAQGSYPGVALFILAQVAVDNSVEPPVVSGGQAIVLDPWRIADGELRPVGFEYWRT